jgi:uncharacterized BrkB/YihY/UPF0761 family membrane protein
MNNMKKIRLITALSILVIIILFFAFSFFWMSCNPNNWNEASRGLFVTLDFVFIAFITLGVLSEMP